MLKEDDQHVGCLLREYGKDVPGIIQDIPPTQPPSPPRGKILPNPQHQIIPYLKGQSPYVTNIPLLNKERNF